MTLTLKEAVTIAKQHRAGLNPSSGEAKALSLLIDRCDSTTPALGQLGFGAVLANPKAAPEQKAAAWKLDMSGKRRQLLEALNVARSLALSQNQDYWGCADMFTNQLQSNRGAVAARISDLKAMGYIDTKIAKSPVSNQPVTFAQINKAGRAALQEHREQQKAARRDEHSNV